MNPPTRALLISPYLNAKDKELAEEHLEELVELTKTFGKEVVEKRTCLSKKIEASTYITSGKVDEMLTLANECGADLIIFDDEIAPSQQRNLEAIFKRPVMDRTELILGVFAQRAQTKEAKLQIDLAKVKYEAPRLKRLWTHLSRQQGSAGGGAGGGGGYLKGEGEKQIEIDRRIIKKKVDQLQKDLEEVQKQRSIQRNARERSGIPSFAIIGYTNAGKSTLLNQLTDAKVFVEDQLFATLDPTTRKFSLPNDQEIVLVDTVGFIRKLPHLLVASFKSTLEEALYADFLLHVVDISHPAALAHTETTYEVLKELNAGERPIIHVLNKIDKVENPIVVRQFKIKYPNTVEISALQREGISELLEKMIEELKKRRQKVTLKIPQSDYAVVSEVIASGQVLSTAYEENDIIVTAHLPQAMIGKWQKYFLEE